MSDEMMNNLVKPLEAQHDQYEAQFKKLSQAQSTLLHVRSEMDGLVKLGDTITTEDVIKSAANLVGKGLGAVQMATLLADMPTNPQQLTTWVRGHEAQLVQREQQLKPILASVRHEMGVSALRVLAAHSMMGPSQMGVQPEGEGQGGNQLALGPQGDPAGAAPGQDTGGMNQLGVS